VKSAAARQRDYAEYAQLFPYIEKYQALANRYKIMDIFQDNGGKYLQLLLLLGLTTSGKRLGNDASDAAGAEFEIKTVNIDLTRSFSTHHHMNRAIIAKYRKVHWYFAIYRSIRLEAIYKLTPKSMGHYYRLWTAKWDANNKASAKAVSKSKKGAKKTTRKPTKDINNPKVAVSYVIDHGEIVWPKGAKTYTLPPKPRKPVAVVKNMPIQSLRKKVPRKTTSRAHPGLQKKAA
jgi:hypothetical protein